MKNVAPDEFCLVNIESNTQMFIALNDEINF